MKWVLTNDRKLKPVFEGPMAGYEPPAYHPTVSIVYVYPVLPSLGDVPYNYSRRFLRGYQAHFPIIDHESIVVINGGGVNSALKEHFRPLKNLRFIEHDDSGWDIGAFQRAARECDSELMVFFGTSIYFQGDGWLERMVDATHRRGVGLYGAMGNRGAKLMPTYPDVYPHVRTTGFWTWRDLFNRYPMRVTRKEQRYEFEHGRGCLAEWLKHQGIKTWVTSWYGEYKWEDWDILNGYQSGDQSAMLVGDRLTEPPFYTLRPRIPTPENAAPNRNLLPLPLLSRRPAATAP